MLTRRRCCCTTGGGFTQTITVYGCVTPAINPALFAGITVRVRTSSGGSILASGPTNSSGQVSLSWSGSDGNYWVEVVAPNARFNDYGATRSLTDGGSITAQLPVGTDYACCASTLDIPLKLTGWSYTDDNGTYSVGRCGNLAVYTTPYDVSPNAQGTACGPTTVDITANIVPTAFGGLNRLNIIRSWRSGTCGTGDAYCTGTPADGCIYTDSSTVYYEITSLAIPIAATVTPVANGANHMADPVGGNVTFSEV